MTYLIIILTKIFIFIFSLQEYCSSFCFSEINLISLAFISLENVQINISLYFSTFYFFLFNLPFHIIKPINTLLLFGCDISEEFSILYCLFCLNLETIFYISCITLICVFFQSFLHFNSKNFRRKIFHFVGFVIFMRKNLFTIYFSQFLLYFLLCFSVTKFPKKLFKVFINEKDFGKGIFSHIYLLCSLLYPYFYLDDVSYVKSLISICIMDSFASIFGIAFKSKTKSIIGFIAGQISAYLAEFIFLRSFDFKYHFFIGLIEYFCPINDNIVIPIVSTIHLRALYNRKIRLNNVL